MTYATLAQMQDMELGVTGYTRTINDCQFEMMVGDDGLYGWAALHIDVNGDAVDWDRVPEDEARELGLIKGAV
jgi:hypothetical protein